MLMSEASAKCEQKVGYLLISPMLDNGKLMATGEQNVHL